MRVVVALSGGVDSSVAAGLLAEQGHEVIGVHMKLHDAPAATPVSSKSCCGLDDALDARLVCERLGVPFYVMDLRAAFEKAVMEEFAAVYAAGGTPNPCVSCNGVLKFRVLLARARALGASHLATGHYARIGPSGAVQRAVDLDKDQSYFLFPLSAEARRAALFPLGHLRKDEVRAHARRMGLITADKPESQEVCFLPTGDHTSFVRAQTGIDGAGDIVDESGAVLGHHDGYFRFTVGQRRGLALGGGPPLYVLRVDADTRRVVVGPDERLQHTRVRARAMVWASEAPPLPGAVLSARIRHRGALVPCTVEAESPDAAALHLRVPARAATKGQAVVLYDGDDVVGGGWISEVSA